MHKNLANVPSFAHELDHQGVPHHHRRRRRCREASESTNIVAWIAGHLGITVCDSSRNIILILVCDDNSIILPVKFHDFFQIVICQTRLNQVTESIFPNKNELVFIPQVKKLLTKSKQISIIFL